MVKARVSKTELLNQPIVITLELNAISSIFLRAAPAVASQSVVPDQLEDGWFQCRSVHAADSSALMTPMPMGQGYSFPLKAFYQNEIEVPLTKTADLQSITLTGFRAGDVRSIFFWVEDMDQTAAGNPYNWVMPRDVELLYNGLQYQRFKGTSSQIWDLMATDVPAQFSNSVLAQSGSGVADTAFTSSAKLTNWINMPFSQIYEQLSGTHLMVRGKEILNAVVNVNLRLPSAASTLGYKLHAVYSYNCVLFESAGSAEYVF